MVIVMFLTNIGCKNVYSETTDTEQVQIETLDMKDLNNWKSGCYNWTDGQYMEYGSRICLNEYVIFSEDEFEAVVGDESYRLLVRELDKNNKFIKSTTLKNGDKFIPQENTAYLGISVYNAVNEWSISYNTFKRLFEEGVSFELVSGEINEPEVDNSMSNGNIGGTAELFIENLDLTDIQNWKTGCYSWMDGSYMENNERICLNEYVRFNSDSYTIIIGDTGYQMTIRELDANKKFICSKNLKNGDVYNPSSNTVYLAVSLYHASGEWGTKFATYEKLLADNMELKVTADGMIVDDVTSSGSTSNDGTVSDEVIVKDDSIESCDVSLFENWEKGTYTYIDGTYENNSERICLNEYKTFTEGVYAITISNTTYKLLVRELDANKKFIKSVTLVDGNTYAPSSNAKYLGISLYNGTNEWGMSYDKYKKLFEDGMVVKIQAKSAPEKVYDNFRDELKDMLESGDATAHDVSKYKMDFNTYYNKVYTELINGECYLANASLVDTVIQSTKDENGIIQTVWFQGMDADFVNRYELVKQAVAEVKTLIRPEMTDIEKTLIAHDYVVEKTSYTNCYGDRSASMSLAYGKGVCVGYASAMQVLLHEMGIESYCIGSNSLNHTWLMAKIDGQYYHIDPTWDDTRTAKSGEVDHEYFIRNDAEFKNSCRSSHYGWVSYEINATSTSTLYENWFVHDVVGKMLYNDGYWYYADGNKIMKAHIDGSDMSVVAEENSDVKLIGFTDGILHFSVSGVEKSL
jgi:hypothetical protein